MSIKKEVGLENYHDVLCALAQASKLISFIEVLMEQIGDEVSMHFDEIPQDVSEKISLMVSTGLYISERYNHDFLSGFIGNAESEGSE